MKEVDEDKDGKINFKEFVNAMANTIDTSFVDLTNMRL